MRIDASGKVTLETASTGSTKYTWDLENRLGSVTPPGSAGTVRLKYDPFGRRIYKSSCAGTSIYAYDGANLVEETNSSGTVVARYAQGLNIDEPLAMLQSGTTSFYHADALGSVTSLSNGTGALVQTYAYDSFAKQTVSSGSLINRFQYIGREFDSETGLYFLRTRYFDPAIGRFLGEDPIRNLGGINFFRYVGNNPLRYVDPLGLMNIEYNVTYRNSSWILGADFYVDLPPVVRYDCKCVGKGEFQLQLTVIFDIRIFYGSKGQLKHEKEHLAILTSQYDSRKSYYEKTYEKVYSSLGECENDSWRLRYEILRDLQNDFKVQGERQNAHDDLLQRLWKWIASKR